jgi:hypothetical protein
MRHIQSGVAVALLLTGTGLAAGRHAEAPEPRNGRVVHAAERDYSGLTEENRTELLTAIVDSAVPSWERAGITGEQLDGLRAAALKWLEATAAPDFETYHLMARSAGGTLGATAERVVKKKIATGQYGSEPATGDVKRDLTRLWMDAARRNAVWSGVERGALSAGVGPSTFAGENGTTLISQQSLYDFPNQDKLMERYSRGELTSPWFVVGVRYSPAHSARVRFVFVRDPDSGQWLPVREDAVVYGSVLPVLLL